MKSSENIKLSEASDYDMIIISKLLQPRRSGYEN